MTLLAVYGTLRTNGRLSHYISAERENPVRLNGYKMKYSYGIPFVTKGEGSVVVQPVEVTDEELRNVRVLESGYEETEIILPDGRTALIYLSDYPGTEVPSGDFSDTGNL